MKTNPALFTGAIPLRPLGQVIPVRTLRDPLTGPIRVLAAEQLPTVDPGHWWPRHDEPIYRALYELHRERLHAGLLAGTVGEQVTA